jgi:hypothetical protein
MRKNILFGNRYNNGEIQIKLLLFFDVNDRK